MEGAADNENTLFAMPGDVLFSTFAVPPPDSILKGSAEDDEPLQVDFAALQRFLEFLEFVVLTERLIVPAPQFREGTQRLIDDPELGFEFQAFRFPGALDYRMDQVVAELERAGVMIPAVIKVGDATADDLVERLLPTSAALRARHAEFLDHAEGYGEDLSTQIAEAKLAVWLGAPLHVSAAAGQAKVPYVLGGLEERHVAAFEAENLSVRQSLGQYLLDTIGSSARAELDGLARLGVPTTFPETPISSLLLHEASSPADLVEVALQLRADCASFRASLNALERDLLDEDLSVKVRLKRLQELESLARSTWPSGERGFGIAAVGVAEAILAVPEVAAVPTPSGVKRLVDRWNGLPRDTLMRLFRRKKLRVFIRARRSFLGGKDVAPHLARLLSVPEAIVRGSRVAAGKPSGTGKADGSAF